MVDVHGTPSGLECQRFQNLYFLRLSTKEAGLIYLFTQEEEGSMVISAARHFRGLVKLPSQFFRSIIQFFSMDRMPANITEAIVALLSGHKKGIFSPFGQMARFLAVVTAIVFFYTPSSSSEKTFILWVVGLFLLAFIVCYVYFMVCNPKCLQSEDQQTLDRSLDLMQDKGFGAEALGEVIKAVRNTKESTTSSRRSKGSGI